MKSNNIEYILFARSIPEYSKRYGGTYSCSLGYSPTLKSLIRVYPVPIIKMYSWEMYNISVEKNNLDSRVESYKFSSTTKYENWSGVEKHLLFVKKFQKAQVFNLMEHLKL